MLIEVKNPDTLFPIGFIAKMFDVSVATIRLYESEGLVIPHKSKGKHRLYSQNDMKRIECIRDLLDEKGLNFAGIRLMLSTIPCWELKPCAEEDRKNCDAYHKSLVPCWMVENKGDICKNEDCSQCTVYQKSSECSNTKVILKKYWRSSPNEE